VLLISASPGPAMALIFRRAALTGFSGAVPTVLGLELGLYVWALCAAAGLAAIVAASQVAFVVPRIAGAVFLVYLGVRAWRTASRARGEETPEAEVTAGGWWRVFGEGTLVQLANPKAAIEVVFYLALAAVVGRAGAWFRRTTVRRRLEAVSGTVLIALGLRLATTTC
jgi:threonine/homoserine/homoserine lactone efflux protein